MNRRKVAIQVIIAEVAQTGVAGRCAIRAFVETRMSRATFDDACRIGQKIYERTKGAKEPMPLSQVPGVFYAKV